MFKTVKISALILASTFILSGCASQEVNNKTYAFDAVKTSQMPSWNEASVESLKKEGWNFTVSTVAPETKDVKNLPDVIFGVNKNQTCTIEFNSLIDLPTNETLGDRFNTQSYIIKYIQSSMSDETRTAQIKETQINVTDSSNKLAVSESKYESPYYDNGSTGGMQEPINGQEVVLPESSGTVYSYILARALTANYIDNPMLKLYDKTSAAKIEPKGTPIITVSYKCLNQPLDEKIIQTIQKDATITIK